MKTNYELRYAAHPDDARGYDNKFAFALGLCVSLHIVSARPTIFGKP